MNREEKRKIAYRTALISGIFCGLVALLLLLNFWQMKQHEPLESESIEALIQRLSEDPDNETLKKEIRDFDLLARKAYFTSRWQIKAGTWLLLIGGIILVVSLKVYIDLRASIERPEEVTEELLKARANAQYWLFLAGGVILGLALTAALLNTDYLSDYDRLVESGSPVQPRDSVEVIDVFAGTGPEEGTQAGDTAASGPGRAPGTDGVQTRTDPGGSGRTTTGGDGEAVSSAEAGSPEAVRQDATRVAAASVPFNRQDYRRYHATFRGYMGQGVSYHENIPVQWDGSTGEHVKWKVAFSRSGYNSPIIWGDRLFISGGDEEALVVACYNRHTGQLQWEKEVTGIPGSPSAMPRVTEDTGLAAPTMAADGNRVYAIFATGDVIAFDHAGNRIWARNLGVPSNHYGHSSSLMIWENKLVVQYDTNTRGRMMALDTRTGDPIWDVERPVHISWASPVLIEAGDAIQVVTTADPYVSAHDLQTGEEIWKVEAMMGEVGPSVAYGDGLVYATQEYARNVAITPTEDPEIVWEDDEYLSEVASPVVANGLYFLATSYGVLVCYDAKTGEKVWEKEFNDGFYSSPMVADGKLYISDMGGVTHILRADRTGTLVGEPALGEPIYALPAFADGVIYLRGEEHLYGIEK